MLETLSNPPKKCLTEADNPTYVTFPFIPGNVSTDMYSQAPHDIPVHQCAQVLLFSEIAIVDKYTMMFQ